MLLLFDNYDSFTYNIYQLLASLGAEVEVVRNDAVTPEDVLAAHYEAVILSPGPGLPKDAGNLEMLIEAAKGKVPLLGICLGHQLLALASGARTVKMKFGHHGTNHPVQDLSTGKVMITSQNHGFTVDPETLPDGLKPTHISLFDGSLQGIERTDAPAFSFQGHPEASSGPHDVADLFDGFIEKMAAAPAK